MTTIMISRATARRKPPPSPSRAKPKADRDDDADEAETREIHFWLIVSRVLRGKADPEDVIDELRDLGKSRQDLEDAIAKIHEEGTPAPSPAAKVCPPVPKENKMSVYQQTKQQWDAAIRQYAEQHPRMSATACISAVAKANPQLHERLVSQANAERVERRNKS